LAVFLFLQKLILPHQFTKVHLLPKVKKKLIWACHHPDKWANSLCAYSPIYQDAVGLSMLLRQLISIPHAKPFNKTIGIHSKSFKNKLHCQKNTYISNNPLKTGV